MLTTRLYRHCVIPGLLAMTIAAHGQVPASLEIANPNPVGSGARALGQANAFIAITDDATAATWNPGGLTELQIPEVSMAVEAVNQRTKTAGNRDRVALEDYNFFSMVYPLPLNHHVVVSLNYLKLFRFDRDFQLPFSNTRVLSDGRMLETFGAYGFDQEGEFSVVSPAIALQLTPKLSLGLSLNVWNHSITQSSSFSTRELTRSSQNLDGSVTTFDPFIQENRFRVEEGYSLAIGSLYRLNGDWAFGAVIKPAYELELDHEQTFSVFQGGTPVFRSDLSREADAELEFPWIIGLGAAWQPVDEWTVSTDFTWTQWSEYRFYENGRDQNPVDAGNDDLDDTFTMRVGAEYLWIRSGTHHFALRCGLGYDPAPGVGQADDYYTVNAGVGWHYARRFSLDLGYEYRWGNDINADSLAPFNTSQDSQRHRVLVSLICYFDKEN